MVGAQQTTMNYNNTSMGSSLDIDLTGHLYYYPNNDDSKVNWEALYLEPQADQMVIESHNEIENDLTIFEDNCLSFMEAQFLDFEGDFFDSYPATCDAPVIQPIIQPMIQPMIQNESVKKSCTFSCSLECRTGKNLPWSKTNNAPQKIHKSRQICINTPATDSHPFTIIIKLALVSGSNQGSQCFLSNEEGTKAIGNTENNEIRVRCNGKIENEVKCFLHTAKGKGKDLSKYKISVYCSVDNQRTLIHSFETQPLKNHKWESGNKGRFQNTNNLQPVRKDVLFSPINNV